ncbi:HIT-like protein [Gloeophyllum trabeum ATCC 11539]|uniref:HIT-like protein n=1 Tax=Gloeophyllum trabeum (strain ATCC 11539 / FP-39264 / Madison 617) TaxID=670483 RepID=S7Q2D9_GLOTA|nr:HIT-like protein [Gloeophyllum trabeum ATCC 11539]EPQ54171.1 HIT-like protein [Gloeophyllum trabeum ATCC 11539]
MVFQLLSSLLASHSPGRCKTSQEVLRVSDINPPVSRHCSFCGVSVEKGFDVVWEDRDYIVFRDYRPSAAHHLQVIPKKHIDSVRSLRKEHIALVRSMGEIGHRVLDALNVPAISRRLGFHIPPFNSVDHLHLHVQALPYKPQARRLKYPVMEGGRDDIKGFTWFVTLEQTVKILEKGSKVGVFPC